MNFKIPSSFRGIDGKKAYEKIMKRKDNEGQKPPKKNEGQTFEFKNPNITKSDYIQIPGTGKVISKFEIQGYNHMNWKDTHFKLQENELYMPVVPLFMSHFMNVLDCYQNNKPLFDASGNPIPKKEIKDIALHMLKNHIAIYGTQERAWTWLDAYFEKQNKMKILSEHRIKIDSYRNKILVPQKIEDLETCLMENCYVDLEFNSQGLPIKTSSSQSYDLGNNIYFCVPENEKVAGFDADSDRACLDCNWYPSGRISGRGVYAVAQEWK